MIRSAGIGRRERLEAHIPLKDNATMKREIIPASIFFRCVICLSSLFFVCENSSGLLSLILIDAPLHLLHNFYILIIMLILVQLLVQLLVQMVQLRCSSPLWCSIVHLRIVLI